MKNDTQGVTFKRFRTLKKSRVQPDDSKSYSNAGLKMLCRRGRWRCAKVSNFRAWNPHFALGRQVSRMVDYTNAELTDVHLAYRAADCSRTAVQRLYVQRYPTRHIHSHNLFASQRLAEIGSFQRTCRERVRIARIPAIE